MMLRWQGFQSIPSEPNANSFLCQGIDGFVINYFFRAIVKLLQSKGPLGNLQRNPSDIASVAGPDIASVDDVKDEIFDMVKSKTLLGTEKSPWTSHVFWLVTLERFFASFFWVGTGGCYRGGWLTLQEPCQHRGIWLVYTYDITYDTIVIGTTLGNHRTCMKVVSKSETKQPK